jgi:hypothetical protein
MTALRADNARVIAQLSILASRSEVTACQNELVASKDEATACKDALLASTKELQQYKDSVTNTSNTAANSCPTCRSNVEAESPLDKDEMLDHVFGFVGGGDHAYTAGVSRRWRGRYLQYCAHNSTSYFDKKCVTRHRSVLITERRLQLAKAYGLDIAAFSLQNARCTDTLCQHSLQPKQVITVLRVHGVQWGSALCSSAAFYNRLSLLQWLRRSSCCWDEAGVLVNACRTNSVAVLEWLAGVTQPWSGSTTAKMLDRAAWFDKLAAAQ